MLKKFTEGLVFGSGFAISFITIWYIAAYLIYPMFIGPQLEQSISKQLSGIEPDYRYSIPQNIKEPSKSEKPFHELAVEEQIKQASVIALAKYEPAPDGKMNAIIKEFLKKDPGTTIYYNVGDAHPTSSYYPKAKTRYGDGLIIFFTGSPATMKMSMSYSGDRIHSLGDIPLELFREKCNDSDV